MHWYDMQQYKEIRNFLINKYREDTTRTLTATEARTLLGGDASGIFRIWQFLDHWGIINFQATDRPNKNESVPPNVSPAGVIGSLHTVGQLSRYEVPMATHGSDLGSLTHA